MKAFRFNFWMIAIMLVITIGSYALGMFQYKWWDILLGLWWVIVIVIAYITLSNRKK